nr:MAG TPA: hypothetical protein [Caudoviricetes sp.]
MPSSDGICRTMRSVRPWGTDRVPYSLRRV